MLFLNIIPFNPDNDNIIGPLPHFFPTSLLILCKAPAVSHTVLHGIWLLSFPLGEPRFIWFLLTSIISRMGGWLVLNEYKGKSKEKPLGKYFCHENESVNYSVMPSSLPPHRLYPTRLLCPWNLPGKNTGVGCHFLLQAIFPTQG